MNVELSIGRTLLDFGNGRALKQVDAFLDSLGADVERIIEVRHICIGFWLIIIAVALIIIRLVTKLLFIDGTAVHRLLDLGVVAHRRF